MGAALSNVRSTLLRQLSEGLADMGSSVGDWAAEPRPPEPRPPRPTGMCYAQAVEPKTFLMSPRPKRTLSIDGVHAGYIFFDPAYRLDSPPERPHHVSHSAATEPPSTPTPDHSQAPTERGTGPAFRASRPQLRS